MYAIIRTGGKQAKVREGDVIDVERIKGKDEITFTPLLLVKDDGSVVSDRSALEKVTVTAEIVGENRGPKVDVFKYKAKTGYRRSQGHRQTYSRLQITKIAGPGTGKRRTTKKVAADTSTETTAEAEPAADETATEED
jgi:large subunit ribosomal protein L21